MSLITRLVSSYAKKENLAIQKSIEAYRERLPEDVTIERDLVFDSEDGKCQMTVYYPTCHETLPVIINVHGGGMVCGVMEQNDLLCAKIAREGYLVFAIDYPLMPEADIYKMYRILAHEINRVNELAPSYNGEMNKIYWTGDSAGGYLITNMAAMRASDELREAFNVPPIITPIKALGLISGMLYTNKKDPLSMVLPNMMFGKGYKKTAIYPYTDLERPEFIDSLPPIYMVSSAEDMLREHTMSYFYALNARGHNVRLSMFGKDKKLVHAFVALYPDYPESEKSYKEMLQFFEKINAKYVKEKIIAACGNDCAQCPRHLPKSDEELRHTAELWMKIGYRDRIVSNDEIACKGCSTDNWCRYKVVQCVADCGIVNCGQCDEYPCDNMKACFEVTRSFEPACKAVCTEEEYLALKGAFFEKEENLKRK